jgi:hypothetical protein
MSAPGITLAQLSRMGACAESRARVRKLLKAVDDTKGRVFTAADAKTAGCTFGDVLWAASQVARNDAAVERKLRHFMADCAARVLHIANDPRSTAAVVASREYAEGRITAGQLDAARDAAWDAARDAARDAAWDAAWDAARDAAWDAARDAARDAAWAAARAAAWDAAWGAARAAAWDAAWAAEESWQFDRLCAWLSDDEPQPWPIPQERIAA